MQSALACQSTISELHTTKNSDFYVEVDMTAVKYHAGKFPPKTIDWMKLIPLLGPASGALARFDGVLHAVPNALVLLSPLSTQEAVLSSKIEGTQATMGDCRPKKSFHDPQHRWCSLAH